MTRLLAALLALLLLTGCAQASPRPTQEADAPAPTHSPEDACREAAQALGDAQGIRILVLEEAAQTAPWDYSLAASQSASDTLSALTTLEALLSCFPEGFLAQLWEGRDSLTLCLVESIRGSQASGSLPHAQGLQFEADGHAFLILALAPAGELRYTLAHELGHLIDSRVVRLSGAYDRWSDLNPRDFSYSLDVNADLTPNQTYLTGGDRCFVDAYAMTYPAEDRARILEYAMNPGNEGVFAAPGMQRKLQRVCAGIRESFGLTGDRGAFLWEQYLEE